MLSVADALARVLADAKALPPADTALVDAHGRVLARDVAALRTQPPASMSAMDGYAVRAADVADVPAQSEDRRRSGRRPAVRKGRWSARGRPHLHRWRRAGGRRHHRDPGTHHAQRR